MSELNVNTANIAYMNYLIRTYQAVTKGIASTKNRLQSLPGDHPVKFDNILHGEDNGKNKEVGLITIKGRIARMVGNELIHWDIWNLWLKDIPGIGPVTAAELIMLYYYRFIPVCSKCKTDIEKINDTYWCSKCEKSLKGDGLLNYRTEEKDFANISKWWAYMGRDIRDGAMRKKKKGEQMNWSAAGRKLGFLIGECFNKQQPDHLYKKVWLEERAKYHKVPEKTRWTTGHIYNASKNNTVKLFLAHFWTVARTLSGKDVTLPYAMTIMGHTGYVAPFYFDPKVAKEIAA